MSEGPYETAHLDAIPSVQVVDDLTWIPVRRHLGVGAFGINAYRAAGVGDQVVEDHDESSGGAGHHEEVYFVASGHATFTVAGDELDAPAGTFVFVRDPAARRKAVASEPGTTVVVVGAERGAAFEPSVWEYYFSAVPFARAGDYAAAVDRVAAGLAERRRASVVALQPRVLRGARRSPGGRAPPSGASGRARSRGTRMGEG